MKTSILLCHPSIYAQALQKSGLGARESLSTPGLFLAALGGRWMTFQIMGRGDCNGNNCKSGKVDTILKRTQISQQLSVWPQLQSWNLIIIVMHYSCRSQQAKIKHFLCIASIFVSFKAKKDREMGKEPPTPPKKRKRNKRNEKKGEKSQTKQDQTWPPSSLAI